MPVALTDVPITSGIQSEWLTARHCWTTVAFFHM